MAYGNVREDRVVRSTAYPGCWYCQACRCTFSAGGGSWVHFSPARGSTNPSDDRLWGGFKTVDGECPTCRRRAEGG
jgi:hypothetical protein